MDNLFPIFQTSSSPSMGLVFPASQHCYRFFFSLSCYFLDIEYRVSMRYGGEKKKRKINCPSAFRPSANFMFDSVDSVVLDNNKGRVTYKLELVGDEGRNFLDASVRAEESEPERDRCFVESVEPEGWQTLNNGCSRLQHPVVCARAY